MGFKRSVVLGIFASSLLAAQVSAATVIITDDSIQAGQTKTWVASNTYILRGKVCIEKGATLTIPAGTKVLGDVGTGSSVSMLVVCRGGKLYAQGTASSPVIFTSVMDTMGTPLPISNLARGLWGGLYILGRAQNNVPGGVALVSDITIPATDTAKYRYGDSVNTNLHDNSGSLKYVSIRYAGATDVSTLKGLSLLSVGDSTVIDHIENYMSGDDGLNALGGTVNIKYLVSGFSSGDAVYYSNGYRGKMQFVFAIQDTISGGSSNGCMSKIETDSYLGNLPFTQGKVYNATYVGTGATNKDTWKYKYGIYYKKGGAGHFVNSILTQCYNYGLYVEDMGTADSVQKYNCRARMNEGNLIIKNNIFYGFGKGNTIDSVTKGNVSWLGGYVAADSNHNDLVDPQLGGFGWGRDGLLDPRPSASGVAIQHVATVPNDSFYVQTTYRGAFDPSASLWLTGWTELATTGFFKPASVGVLRGAPIRNNNATRFMTVVSNGDAHVINWNQLSSGNVAVSLLKLNGQQIAELSNGFKSAGAQSLTVSTKGITAGVYLLRMISAGQIHTCVVDKK